MQADNTQLLEQLRDIHAAAEPSLWPPAPGWWVLATLLFILLFLMGRLMARKLRDRRRRQTFLIEIDRLGDDLPSDGAEREYLAGINRLFRIIALRAFPDTGCAKMQGEEWVVFIRSLLPGVADTSSLEVLAFGPYQQTPIVDRQALADHARTWVKLYG